MWFYVLRGADEECDIHPGPGKIVRQTLAERNGQGDQISAANVNTCEEAAIFIWKSRSASHTGSFFLCINSLMITTEG